MSILTEPIGSIPRPLRLIEALAMRGAEDPALDPLYEQAIEDLIDPYIETAKQIRDRVLRAAQYIPLEQLGTCDDCGFSPFCDDTTTTRDTAFAKIRARVVGTSLAAKILGAD